MVFIMDLPSRTTLSVCCLFVEVTVYCILGVDRIESVFGSMTKVEIVCSSLDG